jgi:hypothetical protein
MRTSLGEPRCLLQKMTALRAKGALSGDDSFRCIVHNDLAETKGGPDMGKAMRLIAISLLNVALIVLAAPLGATAATLYVHDPLDTTAATCPTPSYPTIQAAVTDAAPTGDTIVVCNGSYLEQVTVLDKSLTIEAAADSLGNQAIVMAPAVMTDPKAIILITGMLAIVTIDGLIVEGPGGGTCDSIRYGIRVDHGAMATLAHNLIKDIHDTPFGGCQNGIGILVGEAAETTTGSANIQGNTITDYQKGGIVVDNSGSTAMIMNNIIIGVGRTEVIAQNGVQVSRGAMVPPANVQGNTISANFYLNSSPSTTPAVATGILYFQSGDPSFVGPLNSTNTLRHNQVNVSVIP